MDKKKIGGKLVLAGLFVGCYIAGEKLAIRKLKKLKEERDKKQMEVNKLEKATELLKNKTEELKEKIKNIRA